MRTTEEVAHDSQEADPHPHPRADVLRRIHRNSTRCVQYEDASSAECSDPRSFNTTSEYCRFRVRPSRSRRNRSTCEFAARRERTCITTAREARWLVVGDFHPRPDACTTVVHAARGLPTFGHDVMRYAGENVASRHPPVGTGVASLFSHHAAGEQESTLCASDPFLESR